MKWKSMGSGVVKAWFIYWAFPRCGHCPEALLLSITRFPQVTGRWHDASLETRGLRRAKLGLDQPARKWPKRHKTWAVWLGSRPLSSNSNCLTAWALKDPMVLNTYRNHSLHLRHVFGTLDYVAKIPPASVGTTLFLFKQKLNICYQIIVLPSSYLNMREKLKCNLLNW